MIGTMPLYISPRVRKKLIEKHDVTEDEVRQCFLNVEGGFLRDTREQHDTNPPTYWFIAETNRRRKLKVLFVVRKLETPNGIQIRTDLKSAFPPDEVEIAIYERRGQC